MARAECSGDKDCQAYHHVHGCFADTQGYCDHIPHNPGWHLDSFCSCNNGWGCQVAWEGHL